MVLSGSIPFLLAPVLEDLGQVTWSFQPSSSTSSRKPSLTASLELTLHQLISYVLFPQCTVCPFSPALTTLCYYLLSHGTIPSHSS